jgi:uncharacterized secreted protein with C-terminal beta-propeller domain
MMIGLAGLAVATTGCGSRRDVAATLYPVSSCRELADTIRQATLKQMNQQLDAQLQSALASAGNNCRYGDAAMGAPTTSASPPSAGTSANKSEEGASQVSGTNNQVAGVDEADFIKNDNKYIYLVSGGAFRIIEAWPAPQSREIAKIPLEGTPLKLFVEGDRALVYVSVPRESSKTTGSYPGGSSECTYGYSCSFIGDGNPTKIYIFDISDRHAPKRVRELGLSGSYVNARRIGSAVHTVISSPGVQFSGLKSWPDEIGYCTEAPIWQVVDAFRRLRQQNTKIINETPLEDFVPSVTDTILSGASPQTAANLLGDCRGFYQPRLTDGTTFTTILSVNLQGNEPVTASTIVSRPGAVYASAKGLYLAVPQTHQSGDDWYASMGAEEEATTVHLFALSSTPPASTYSGSGVVKGRVLNQFAMDEWSGTLRIATTTGHLPSDSVHSTLSVLRAAGGALLTVGALDHLAPKEDIRSVRFEGDRGFIVTFKKTDPLFLFDLSDAEHPRVLSELKIPGFSTYMQLMDPTHLLTIGYDADDQGSFAWFAGVMLQIFDVGDPLNPTLAHKEIIGTRGSSSEALTNHLAFTYFAPKDLLALPMTICEGGSGGGYGDTMTFSGLMVYQVTTAGGFGLQGKVSHATAGATCSNWWTNASSTVKRSIIMDDYVYSVTDTLIKVNHLSNLSVDLAAIPVGN